MGKKRGGVKHVLPKAQTLRECTHTLQAFFYSLFISFFFKADISGKKEKKQLKTLEYCVL